MKAAKAVGKACPPRPVKAVAAGRGNRDGGHQPSRRRNVRIGRGPRNQPKKQSRSKRGQILGAKGICAPVHWVRASERNGSEFPLRQNPTTRRGEVPVTQEVTTPSAGDNPLHCGGVRSLVWEARARRTLSSNRFCANCASFIEGRPPGCRARVRGCCGYHKHQLRRSGDPYITHPVAVAGILADLGMTAPTLAAALLTTRWKTLPTRSRC